MFATLLVNETLNDASGFRNGERCIFDAGKFEAERLDAPLSVFLVVYSFRTFSTRTLPTEPPAVA